MSKRENETFKIKDLMQNMLQENKLQKGIDQITVKEAWKDVMGNGVVSYTESVLLRKNTLIVKLSSAPLREELSYGKNKIVDMLNTSLKKDLIKNIKLV
ncbi:MAG: DUF721 domain-containing protein [Flavobacteriaceae bacterium]|nr:DUF721 domain-containing protein [Flavobacteriaceae bacterium]